MDDIKSLAHTKWNCKYHVVFAPKYRRKVFYEEKRLEIHIHMLLSIPPKISVSGFMGFLKGKSSLMIYQKWGSMKIKYRNRQFWCEGYYVDTVGKNTKAIKEYIAKQLKIDREASQMSIDELDDPFKGGE